MTRAVALRTLIERVADGTLHEQPYGGMPMATACYRIFGDNIANSPWSDAACLGAYHGSLDAVARLESGLRERGWRSRVVESSDGEVFTAQWSARARAEDEGVISTATVPTEPRARLLAVLKALAWEAEHGKA